MATVVYTGCQAYVYVNSALKAIGSVDVTIDQGHGLYKEMGSFWPKAHSFGLKSISGTIRFAWGGNNDGFIRDWYENKTEYPINIYTDSTHYICASGCVLTTFNPQNLEGGSEEPVEVECSWTGLGYDLASFDYNASP